MNADTQALVMLAQTHYWTLVERSGCSGLCSLYVKDDQSVRIFWNEDYRGVLRAERYRDRNLIEEVSADYKGDKTKWHEVMLWLVGLDREMLAPASGFPNH